MVWSRRGSLGTASGLRMRTLMQLTRRTHTTASSSRVHSCSEPRTNQKGLKGGKKKVVRNHSLTRCSMAMSTSGRLGRWGVMMRPERADKGREAEPGREEWREDDCRGEQIQQEKERKGEREREYVCVCVYACVCA